MIWGVLSTFFAGFATIFRKKSMGFKTDIKDLGFMFLGITGPTLLLIILIVLGYINIEVFTFKYVGLSVIMVISWVCSTLISQYVYKREKISLIAPYENLNKILSIILSFFLFGDVSVTSLCIAILVVGIIFVSSYDFKTNYIPKTIQIYAINQVLISINTIILGYILLQISAIEFFMIDKTVAFIILFALIIINKDLFKIRKLEKKFLQTRILASLLGVSSYILSLYIISEFGVTINILLSFIYLIFILCLSYFILGDKPTKKSIIVSIVVVMLVGLGFYFK